ncbi:MAG: aminoacyl-tRNA hydrolase [Proteobacteria bacterium]|nr:aminoacyl-tRNA hydrolase [Pseudomonadota bacterium]
MIEVKHGVLIPEAEVKFTASRSSGPGGQNVNKVDTRVTLWFDVANSKTLSPEQKRRIMSRLAPRVNKSGILRVASQKTRSQAVNRDIAIERFVELLRCALKRLPPRKKTQISKAAKERRLSEKSYRSRLKRERSKRIPIED